MKITIFIARSYSAVVNNYCNASISSSEVDEMGLAAQVETPQPFCPFRGHCSIARGRLSVCSVHCDYGCVIVTFLSVSFS
jgi:hypothetical protein